MTAKTISSHHTNENLHPACIINMCIQHYTKCRNTLCQNTVHMLDVIECSRKPWCERTLVRVPLKRNSDRFYCESCEKISPEERHRVNLQHHRDKRRDQRKRERAKNSGNEGEHCSLTTFPDKIESTESEDEAHDAALIPMDMSQGQRHAPSPSRSGYTKNSGNEKKQSSLRTFHDKVNSAESDDDAHEAALTLIAMSRGQYLAPSSSGSGHAEPEVAVPVQGAQQQYRATLPRNQRPENVMQQEPSVMQGAQHPYRAILPRPPAYQRPENVTQQRPSMNTADPRYATRPSGQP